MNALLNYFWQLFTLKKGPQDFPASPTLITLLLPISIFVGMVNATPLFNSATIALYANLFDISLFAAVLYVALFAVAKSTRWQQVFACYLGVGIASGIAMIAYNNLLGLLGAADLAALLDLFAVIWVQLVLGNIYRHTFDTRLIVGIVVVLAYSIVAFNLINSTFPIVSQ